MFVSWRFYVIKKRRVHSYCSVHNASLHNTCKHDVILDIRIFHSFLFVLYLCLPYFIFSLPSFLVHISNLLCSDFRSNNGLQNHIVFSSFCYCVLLRWSSFLQCFPFLKSIGTYVIPFLCFLLSENLKYSVFFFFVCLRWTLLPVEPIWISCIFHLLSMAKILALKYFNYNQRFLVQRLLYIIVHLTQKALRR